MARQREPEHDRIVLDPAILVGKPVVRGTRIPVELVLARLSENLDLADLYTAYPRLTPEDVKACLAYAQTTVSRRRAARASHHVEGKQPTTA